MRATKIGPWRMWMTEWQAHARFKCSAGCGWRGQTTELAQGRSEGRAKAVLGVVGLLGGD